MESPRNIQSKPNIIVVGNGAIGRSDSGQRLINKHTGQFLLDLKSRGLKVTFADWRSAESTAKPLLNFDLGDHGIEYIEVRTRGLPQRLFALVRLLLRLRSYDFIYIFFPGRLGQIVGLLSAVLQHKFGLYVRGEQFSRTGVDGLLVRRAAFSTTVSPALEEILTANGAQAVSVIRPMIDFSLDDLSRKPYAAREKIRFLYVGRLEERKGVNELIAAFTLLRNRGLDFIELRLVGSGPLQSHSAIGTDTGVTCVGQIDETDQLSREYRDADAFIFASRDEGFPRVVIEAMIHSLPVFARLVGGMSGYLTDGLNCVGLPASPTGIADCIDEWIQKEDVLNQLSNASFETARSILSSKQKHDELVFDGVNTTLGISK